MRFPSVRFKLVSNISSLLQARLKPFLFSIKFGFVNLWIGCPGTGLPGTEFSGAGFFEAGFPQLDFGNFNPVLRPVHFQTGGGSQCC